MKLRNIKVLPDRRLAPVITAIPAEKIVSAAKTAPKNSKAKLIPR